MSDQRPDSDFDDKTVIRQKPNDDKTSVRDAAPDSEPDSGTPDNADDKTVIRGDSSARDTPAASDTPKDPKPDKPKSRGNATILRQSGAVKENATILREPGAAKENATILREPTPSNEHATILRGTSDSSTILRDGAGSDSTVMRDGASTGGDDSTVINPSHDDDSTVVGDGARSKADTTYIASVGRQESKGNSEAGRLLKNRFVLEEKVGSGGMGDVYKALDLRQQEAQERNPYIAIKILNEHFSRHKDAFISLQREATRTRGIPHPNIMAVYDFDREGDTVFMSMELLDGKPLDDYLKDHPEGVSVDDAWNIIDGICQGLSRAHGAGIVHSDFKPGNIYYTADKLAKVFDFGIARAVASPGDIKADGEKTVFDAGSLGALTPTYASLEMLTGKEPTKSDDVYAVALVAYELFTGKHPYNRTPADKALERGLQPEPIPFLKRRHWRALKKGLALKGEDRYQSIDEFYEGMFSEDPPYFRYSAVAAVLIVSVGFAAYSFLNPEEVPPELTELQGQLGADRNNLRNRIGDPPNAVNWNFESSDWREEVKGSLTRMRGLTLQLEEDWPEYWVEMVKDPATPNVEKWKANVLKAYLGTVAKIREKVAGVEVQGDVLEDRLTQAQGALDELLRAQTYMREMQEYFNFDPQAINDENSRLEQAIQYRELLRDTINKDIVERNERVAAEEAARIAREEAELRRNQRNSSYKELIAEFTDVLRCKGTIDDSGLARLNVILNGGSLPNGDQTAGMPSTYPDQYAVDRPGIVTALRGCIEQRIAVRDPDRARLVRDRVNRMLGGEPMIANIVIEDLDPCGAGTLVGRGNRNGSWCSDRLAVGGTGPELVVIPKLRATDSDDANYAISRIEIKISDYNQFCQETGCAQVAGPGTLPVTNIPLSQARAYTAWLSDQTGKRYRLPTEEEWLHAARTDGNEAIDDNINCTVDSRGVRLGEKLLSTLSGRPNKWGLYNYVGNAREWAVEGDSVVALGGAHTDPKSECSIEKKTAHTGQPDPVTGFRIVRPIEKAGSS